MTHDTPYDVLVIGSGAAGLGMALRLDSGLRIGVVSKRELREGNTLYAQGGISAVLSDKDSIESHVQDTMIAGAGLCDEATVGLDVRSRTDIVDDVHRLAAEQGLAGSQTTLAMMYEQGNGVEKDPEKAREWYARAGFDMSS